jgi:hypothetical protein
MGVGIREMDTDTGPADYMLFIQGKACGIIEAKREGANLGHVAEQSGRYPVLFRNLDMFLGDHILGLLAQTIDTQMNHIANFQVRWWVETQSNTWGRAR